MVWIVPVLAGLHSLESQIHPDKPPISRGGEACSRPPTLSLGAGARHGLGLWRLCGLSQREAQRVGLLS